MPTVTLQRTTLDDAAVIENLWPAYQLEVSEYQDSLPNRPRPSGAPDPVPTPAELRESLAPWWREPDDLFPYAILADGAPAGFDLIARGRRVPAGVPADAVVHEFFVLPPYRGTGVAERAAILGFEQHPGRWEVVTYPSHARAIAFWRRVIGRYTGGEYTEREGEHPWGRRAIFRFENGGRSNPTSDLPRSGRSPIRTAMRPQRPLRAPSTDHTNSCTL